MVLKMKNEMQEQTLHIPDYNIVKDQIVHQYLRDKYPHLSVSKLIQHHLMCKYGTAKSIDNSNSEEKVKNVSRNVRRHVNELYDEPGSPGRNSKPRAYVLKPIAKMKCCAPLFQFAMHILIEIILDEFEHQILANMSPLDFFSAFSKNNIVKLYLENSALSVKEMVESWCDTIFMRRKNQILQLNPQLRKHIEWFFPIIDFNIYKKFRGTFFKFFK